MSVTQHEDFYHGTGFGSAGPGRVERIPPGKPIEGVYDIHGLPTHSPDGFQCGYAGAGPHHLAAALLWDATEDKALTNAYYKDFCREAVANLGDEWTLAVATVLEFIKSKEAMR